MTTTKPIIIVCGGQWGSEGKGMVAEALGRIEDVDYAVRTGGVNAGHTIWFKDREFKMQQLPVGWTNPKTKLVIGPGAYINHEILDREITEIDSVCGGYVVNRLIIDRRAGTHDYRHTERSQKSGRHHAIGATGKGCSEAVIDRIKNRGGGPDVLYENNQPIWSCIDDTEKILNDAYDAGERILLEGTQGQGLDILLGPWPYTTHKPTSPGQWLVESGLSPGLETDIVMVARTYPIRVAGNSGPMPGETDWVMVAAYINDRLRRRGDAKALQRAVEFDAIVEWITVVGVVGEEYATRGRLPRFTDTNKPMMDFWDWSPALRKQYAYALSELHAEAFGRMPESTQQELRKLFEFTTVTKKLRRVAGWDEEFMQTMVRQIRPKYVVLTFLNYVFPELWGVTDWRQIHPEAMKYVRMREKEMGVWIRYVTTGPRRENLIKVDETC